MKSDIPASRSFSSALQLRLIPKKASGMTEKHDVCYIFPEPEVFFNGSKLGFASGEGQTRPVGTLSPPEQESSRLTSAGAF